MIGRIPTRSIGTWVALALASVAILAVALVIAWLWSGIGESKISLAGGLAMGLGVVIALALGMSLVFLSNRRGYDEAARRDHGKNFQRRRSAAHSGDRLLSEPTDGVSRRLRLSLGC
jgi:hypothetical protein